MQIKFEDRDLEPLIQRVVTRVLDQRQVNDATLGSRIGFTEAEAAGLLGMKPYVLRDARLRGEIVGSRIGKKIYYDRDELLKLLTRNRTEGR